MFSAYVAATETGSENPGTKDKTTTWRRTFCALTSVASGSAQSSNSAFVKEAQIGVSPPADWAYFSRRAGGKWIGLGLAPRANL